MEPSYPDPVEIKLLSFSPKTSRLHIYPTNTLQGSPGHLEPKYKQIRTLILTVDVFDDGHDEADFSELDFPSVLETLPRGFVKDYAFGLGLLKDCNRLVRLIEEHTDCTSLVFTGSDEAVVDGADFRIGVPTFGTIWSEIQRVNDRGNRAATRVKDALARV